MSDIAPQLRVVSHCALLALLVVCAYTDVARGRLYNAVTYTAIFLGFALAILRQPDFATFGPFYDSLAGAGLGAGVFLLVYWRGGVHLGDVKFMAAVGALAADWLFTLRALVLSSIVGMIVALAILIWRGRLSEGLRASWRLFATFGKAKMPATPPPFEHATPAPALTMPYGLAIAAGTMWAWVATTVAGGWAHG